MSWAEDELKSTDLGDRRREQRLLTIVEDLIAQPNASVLQASRDDAAVQGLYKFWSNRRITPAAILSGHVDQTVERCLDHSTVLTIQDTTELDFSTHRHTRGLGPISDASAPGLKVHLTLCSSDAGVPLGILQETVWAREKTRRGAGYRDRPDDSVETVLEEHEWQALYGTIHQTTELPLEPPSIGQCVRWIAKLGGFLGRKGDGEPGVKTLWRGLQRLHDIAATWQLLRASGG